MRFYPWPKQNKFVNVILRRAPNGMREKAQPEKKESEKKRKYEKLFHLSNAKVFHIFVDSFEFTFE